MSVIGSGGFSPGLKRTGDAVTSVSAVLASEHAMFKRAGITLDAALFTADSDGVKIAIAGLVVGKVTATGLYGPYATGATDGTEVAQGILIHDFNLTGGNVIANLLIHGSVLEARVSGLDSGARSALAASIVFQ